MKKLFIALGLASLFMASCSITPKQNDASNNDQNADTNVVVEVKMDTVLGQLVNIQLMREFEKWVQLDSTQKAQLNNKCLEYFATLNAQGIAVSDNEDGTVNIKDYKDPSTMSEEEKAEFDARFAEQKDAWLQSMNENDAESRKAFFVNGLKALLSQFEEPAEVESGKTADSTEVK